MINQSVVSFLLAAVLACATVALWKRDTVPSLITAFVLAGMTIAALLYALGFLVLDLGSLL